MDFVDLFTPETDRDSNEVSASIEEGDTSLPYGVCFANPDDVICNHWNYTWFQYNNVSYSAASVGSFLHDTQTLLKVLGYTSMVCCVITIVTYFFMRPLRCYSRQVVVVYAAVSLYFDLIVIYVVETNLAPESSCQMSDGHCLFLGMLLNFGYSSVCGWTVVLFLQIHRMASDVDAVEPGWTYQLTTHLIVWGTAIAQAIVPYIFDIIGYIGRPANGCGYCFWDDRSIEFIGHDFSDPLQCAPPSPSPSLLPNWGDDQRTARAWLWMAGAFYALVCMFLLLIIFIATRITLWMKMRDDSGFVQEGEHILILSQIHNRKLSVITLMHIAVTLSIICRTVWTANPSLVYNSGHSPYCKLTTQKVLCVPNGCDGENLDQVKVLYNRDTSVFMVLEASISLFAGILNFLLFCVFSSAFKHYLKLWFINLIKNRKLTLNEAAENEIYGYNDEGGSFTEGEESELSESGLTSRSNSYNHQPAPMALSRNKRT